MLKNLLFTLTFCLFAANLACQSSDTMNSNAGNLANSRNSVNLPPEFSNSQLPITANSAPGISAVNGNLQKGTTPTPGIPDPSKIGKTPLPKGATTPGIPDQETLRRQLNTPLKDANVVNNPPQSDKKDERPANQTKPIRKP